MNLSGKTWPVRVSSKQRPGQTIYCPFPMLNYPHTRRSANGMPAHVSIHAPFSLYGSRGSRAVIMLQPYEAD